MVDNDDRTPGIERAVGRSVGRVIDGLDDHRLYTVAEKRRYMEQREQEQREQWRPAEPPENHDRTPKGFLADTMFWLGVFREHERIKAERNRERERVEALSCGEPGHDYTDHPVEYEGRVILDVSLPEGAKGRHLTGPSWTQVPEDKQDLTPRVWNFLPYPFSGSFAEQKWHAAQAQLEEE